MYQISYTEWGDKSREGIQILFQYEYKTIKLWVSFRRWLSGSDSLQRQQANAKASREKAKAGSGKQLGVMAWSRNEWKWSLDQEILGKTELPGKWVSLKMNSFILNYGYTIENFYEEISTHYRVGCWYIKVRIREAGRRLSNGRCGHTEPKPPTHVLSRCFWHECFILGNTFALNFLTQTPSLHHFLILESKSPFLDLDFLIPQR